MTTSKETKTLTPEQYDFYKTQAEPLADNKIMKIYGMDHNQLNAFKKEHGLINKYPRAKGGWQKNNTNNLLFENKKPEEPKRSDFEPGPAEPKLLKENDIPKQRIQKAEKLITVKTVQVDAPILTEKDAPAIAKRLDDKMRAESTKALREPRKAENEGEKEMTEKEIMALVPAFKQEHLEYMAVVGPKLTLDKKTAEALEKADEHLGEFEVVTFSDEPKVEYLLPPGMVQVEQSHLDWLEDRHVRDAEKFYKLEMQLKKAETLRYEEIKRGNDWCDRFRDMEKENADLKAEIAKQDELLKKQADTERLLHMTMTKAGEWYTRILEGDAHE